MTIPKTAIGASAVIKTLCRLPTWASDDQFARRASLLNMTICIVPDVAFQPEELAQLQQFLSETSNEDMCFGSVSLGNTAFFSFF
jgi:protein involved in ribonucleotide reduction